jgi:hypothetical protein
LAAAVVVLLSVTAAAWAVKGSSSRAEVGPLARDDFRNLTTIDHGRISPEATYSFGLILLENHAAAPASVRRVSLVDARGIRLVGSYGVPVSRLNHALTAWDRVFPPQHPVPYDGLLRPLSLVPVMARDPVEVVLALRGVPGGFKGVRFTYDARGREYQWETPTGMFVQ